MKNEKLSFANRLSRGQQVLVFIKSLKDYRSPRIEESKEEFEKLIDSIVLANRSETSAMAEYLMKTNNRRLLFFDSQTSILKIMQAIKVFARIQYGSHSVQFKILKSIMDRMKYERGRRTKAKENKDISKPKTPGRGEKTSGSLVKNFNDFIITIRGFNDFGMSKGLYEIDNLQALLTQMNTINSEVISIELKLQSVKSQRKKLYEELRIRVRRIESNIVALYGKDSNEYRYIKDLVF